MLHIVLYQPEIPPNTGNIIRLCANTGARLHLVKPLGFTLNDNQVKRAGLDYHDMATVSLHEDFAACQKALADRRFFACTTKAKQNYNRADFQDEDVLLFGQETKGLPASILESLPDAFKLRIPMKENNRSLNLSNSVAIILYEAWRQLDFTGAL